MFVNVYFLLVGLIGAAASIAFGLSTQNLVIRYLLMPVASFFGAMAAIAVVALYARRARQARAEQLERVQP